MSGARASVGRGSTRLAFRLDIQGMRAIAVALVLLYHAAVPGVAGGFVGVDVFFVISGFLITSHLLREHEAHGKVRFVAFYARRAQRLLPAAVVVVLASVVAAALFIPRTLLPDELLAAAAALLGVPNMYFAARGSDYLGGDTDSVVQQFWSLGVEEQFYLVWPFVLVLVLRVVRGRRVLAAAIVGVLSAASFALCMALMAWSQPLAFYVLPSRAWELGVGALIAVLGSRITLSRGAASAASWVGLIGLVIAVIAIDGSVAFPGPTAALPVFATALLIVGGLSREGGVQRALGLRPLAWLGDISYSVYLVHWPIMLIPTIASGTPLPISARLLLIVVSVAVGALLHRLVEEPFRRVLRFKARPRTLLAGALTVAVVCAGGVVLARPAVVSSSVSAGVSVAEAGSLSTPPNGSAVLPSNAEPPLMSALDDVAGVYDGPCHISELETSFAECAFGDLSANDSVVLFGDSHAANWFPAFASLADEHDFRLEHYSKSGCASVLVPEVFQNRPYWECEKWREMVIAHLNDTQPDLVVLANYAPLHAPDRREAWAEGIRDIADRLTGVGDVVVLEDTPRHPEGPLECLARNADHALACATPVDEATDDELAAVEALAAEEAGAGDASLNDYLCGIDDCPLVIDQYIVYRDSHHLTSSFSIALAPVLGDRILEPTILGG